jgi:hypothetical protein
MSPPTTETTVAPPSAAARELASPVVPLVSRQFDDASPQARTVAGGCLSVILLGASGDLAKKKTFPAIFNLYKQVQFSNFSVSHCSIYCNTYLTIGDDIVS